MTVGHFLREVRVLGPDLDDLDYDDAPDPSDFDIPDDDLDDADDVPDDDPDDDDHSSCTCAPGQHPYGRSDSQYCDCDPDDDDQDDDLDAERGYNRQPAWEYR